MRRHCSNCPKRDRCTSICSELENVLPPKDGRPRATLSVAGRELAWLIQDTEDQLPPKQREAARLYYRFGMAEEEVAERMGVSRRSVVRYLVAVRRLARNSVTRTAYSRGR